jgi:hypothetical protein
VEYGAAVKYWEIIAEHLKKKWELGCSAIDSNGRMIWIADAHRAATESGSLCERMRS